MMRNKLNVEPHIQWKTISASSLFWWDDWLGISALAYRREDVSSSNNIRVANFINQGHWDTDRFIQVVLQQLVALILNYQI